MASLLRISERVSLRARQLQRMSELYYINQTSRSSAVDGAGPVVSLTSFGRRARTVAFTIESIAQGTLLPSRLILWLDEAALIDAPPAMLRRLQRRGVEILPTANFGPHKKYFPFVASQTRFDTPLVTADDDVLYPRTWLADLMQRHAQDSMSVHCYRARVAELSHAGFAKYVGWRECASTEPSHRNFSIGMAGVLFPEPVLQELKRRGDGFTSGCARTDDIWLNLQAQRVGCKVRQVRPTPDYPMLLPGTQKVGLLHANVEDGNDAALRAIYESADLSRLRAAS